MHARIAAAGVMLAVALVGCGSKPLAAPVTTTQTAAPVTMTQLATITQVATVTEMMTATETSESIYVQTVTEPAKTTSVTKTVKVNVPTTVVQHVVETQTETQSADVPAAAGAEPPLAPGSVSNGNYLVGTEIKPGNYHCSAGDASNVFWETDDKANGIIDNGFGLIAFISSDAYSVTLERCDGTWSLIP